MVEQVSRDYQTYVANRISKVTSLLPPSAWKHVPTLDNPADCASRGLTARELKEHELWWNGPPWLLQEPITVPRQPQTAELATIQGEEAKPSACNVTTVQATVSPSQITSSQTTSWVPGSCSGAATSTTSSTNSTNSPAQQAHSHLSFHLLTLIIFAHVCIFTPLGASQSPGTHHCSMQLIGPIRSLIHSLHIMHLTSCYLTSEDFNF